MGYVASQPILHLPGGIYLFMLLFFWQMPHFWVLALRFKKDYAQGGFPTLPVARGSGVTVSQIVVWCLAYVGLILMAPLFFPVGKIFLTLSLVTCAVVLWELRQFVRSPEGKNWLRFFLGVNFSLIIALAAIALDLWSPILFSTWWT
jgi:protoheme IX farnesyltransferase